MDYRPESGKNNFLRTNLFKEISDMSTKDETVLITGASSGIGEALSWIFAKAGYDLILVD